MYPFTVLKKKYNESSLKFNNGELKKSVCSCGLELLESNIRFVANCCIVVRGNGSLAGM